jgi:sugar phosphate isomerase/epimerase
MRLSDLPGAPELTYCTNIHAGESWDEIRSSLDSHVPRIKARVSPDAPFGLGLRLSGIAAAELRCPAPLEAFREQLSRLGAYVFTLNAFPFGPFHGTRVKEQVYEPDWRTTERVSFTRDAAEILSALLPEGGFGSISTVPGGFKPVGRDPEAVAALVDHLLQAAAHLAVIERAAGKRIALALEPEPCCFLETVDETLAFFEEKLLAPTALARFAALAGLGPAEAEPALRRHLGVCYDVCHGAVEYEDPVAALKRLRGAGIAVPKIQLSAAMRVPAISAPLAARLEKFDDGVYLHQVVVRGEKLQRFVDLPDAFAALREGGAQGEWRIHCHVPVFLADLGELGSTQGSLLATLAALAAAPLSPHLEVETYTWDVLPRELKTGSKADDIARELAFVLEECRDEGRDLVPGGAARDAA